MPNIEILERDLTKASFQISPTDVAFVPGFSAKDDATLDLKYCETIKDFEDNFGTCPRMLYETIVMTNVENIETNKIEDDEEVDGLLLLINTVGGDVEAGLAISEMIASLSKPTCSLVLGGSHSIGVPIAVSTDYSYIVPSATMVISLSALLTVHPCPIS